MPGSYCYLFEAKGIQKYILDSGRLVDLIGASALISDLCSSDENDRLAEVLHACDCMDLRFSRRTGGAFCVHADSRDQLLRLRALWRLVVGVSAPGLAFTDTDPVEAEDEVAALRAAYRTQSGLRENTAAFLPPSGGPMTEFSPRSGRIAVRREKKRDGDLLLDQVTEVQRGHGKALASTAEVDKLATIFLPENDDSRSYLFPRHFEPRDANEENPAFPFGGNENNPVAGDKRIAVIHADISGLGQVFRSVTNTAKTASEVRDVADAIERAVQNASRKASEACLLPFAAREGDRGFERLFGLKDNERPPRGKMVVPARPVVLGGDDITIIIRADLAIRFTDALLRGIATETAKTPIGKLTACAGVTIVSKGHPFLAAHNMAEGMCSVAKSKAKSGRSRDFPSYLAFAVITSSIDEDFKNDYREREQKSFDGAEMNVDAYLIDAEGEDGTTLNNLVDLATALARTEGYGKLLEALGLFHDGAEAAEVTWQRFWEVLEPLAKSDLLGKLNKCIAVPVDSKATEPPQFGDALRVINDALELVDIGAVVIEEVTP